MDKAFSNVIERANNRTLLQEVTEMGKRRRNEDLIYLREVNIRQRIKKQTSLMLSPAVCPPSSNVLLKSGFKRITTYDDGKKVPAIAITVSYGSLFDFYCSLATFVFKRQAYNSIVWVGLRSHHEPFSKENPQILNRENIDLAIVLDAFRDFMGVIIDDGYSVISLASRNGTVSVQLDEHGLIVFYDRSKKHINTIAIFLTGLGLKEDPELKTVNEYAGHSHTSTTQLRDQFNELASSIGACDDEENYENYED